MPVPEGLAGMRVDAGLARLLGLSRSAVQSALAIGPASRAVEGQPPELRDLAAQSIRKALVRYAKGQTVMMPVSLWIVTAVDP